MPPLPNAVSEAASSEVAASQINASTPAPQPWGRTLWRGVCNRCPGCGAGRLLAGYLRPVVKCSACGEAFGHIRADDGPAWLTLVLVGHILAPVLLAVVPNSSWPDWLSMLVWPLVALLLALLILPRAKGAFVAAIWRQKLQKQA